MTWLYTIWDCVNSNLEPLLKKYIS